MSLGVGPSAQPEREVEAINKSVTRADEEPGSGPGAAAVFNEFLQCATLEMELRPGWGWVKLGLAVRDGIDIPATTNGGTFPLAILPIPNNYTS